MTLTKMTLTEFINHFGLFCQSYDGGFSLELNEEIASCFDWCADMIRSRTLDQDKRVLICDTVKKMLNESIENENVII